MAAADGDKDGFCVGFRLDAPVGREEGGVAGWSGAEETHDGFVGAGGDGVGGADLVDLMWGLGEAGLVEGREEVLMGSGV